MKSVNSDEARRTLRDLLNEVEHQGEHVTIMRYKTPAAVLVPVSWYEQMNEALANAMEGGRARRLEEEAAAAREAAG